MDPLPTNMRYHSLPGGFDENGNLPPGIYEIVDEEFRQFFVDNFRKSETRSPLHANYRDYISKLRTFVVLFCQWLDGSYVTNKLNPGDIDLVLHVYAGELSDAEAEKLLDTEYAKENFLCHTFIVPVYPETDIRFRYTMALYKHWLKWFTRDKLNRTKGIVEILR